MSQPEAHVRVGTRRLILGFDGGCFACSGLARRIAEQAGGKVEVLSLTDPQMEAWRRKALGENAPWTPTLIEIKDLKVRAWTGPRMGIALTRFLGPATTWRVMQALGELERLPLSNQSEEIDAASGMSRRRFLAGVGGTAVAMSFMAGSTFFSSSATAMTVDEKKRLAKRIVKNSARFGKLADQQAQIGATFNFAEAPVRIFGGWAAVVRVSSIHSKRSMTAFFGVNLSRETIYWYRHQVAIPVASNRVQYLSYQQGEPLKQLSQVVRQGEINVVRDSDPVTTDYGKTILVKQLEDEARSRNQRLTVQTHNEPDNPCEACVMQEQHDCETSYDGAFLFTPVDEIVGFLITLYAGSSDSHCENYAHDSVFTVACRDECGTASSGSGNC